MNICDAPGWSLHENTRVNGMRVERNINRYMPAVTGKLAKPYVTRLQDCAIPWMKAERAPAAPRPVVTASLTIFNIHSATFARVVSPCAYSLFARVRKCRGRKCRGRKCRGMSAKKSRSEGSDRDKRHEEKRLQPAQAAIRCQTSWSTLLVFRRPAICCW